MPKRFFVKSRQSTFQILFGGLSLLATAFLMWLGSGSFSLLALVLLGLTLLGTGLWLRNHPLIELGDHHLRFKPAPARRTRVISFDDIDRVEPRAHVAVLHTTAGTERLPLDAFEPSERRRLIDTLTDRLERATARRA